MPAVSSPGTAGNSTGSLGRAYRDPDLAGSGPGCVEFDGPEYVGTAVLGGDDGPVHVFPALVQRGSGRTPRCSSAHSVTRRSRVVATGGGEGRSTVAWKACGMPS